MLLDRSKLRYDRSGLLTYNDDDEFYSIATVIVQDDGAVLHFAWSNSAAVRKFRELDDVVQNRRIIIEFLRTETNATFVIENRNINEAAQGVIPVAVLPQLTESSMPVQNSSMNARYTPQYQQSAVNTLGNTVPITTPVFNTRISFVEQTNTSAPNNKIEELLGLDFNNLNNMFKPGELVKIRKGIVERFQLDFVDKAFEERFMVFTAELVTYQDEKLIVLPGVFFGLYPLKSFVTGTQLTYPLPGSWLYKVRRIQPETTKNEEFCEKLLDNFLKE